MTGPAITLALVLATVIFLRALPINQSEPLHSLPESIDLCQPAALPLHGRIDLNCATQETLIELPGIGPATAKKIILYREREGGFNRTEDLLTIRGIGPKKLQAISQYIQW